LLLHKPVDEPRYGSEQQEWKKKKKVQGDADKYLFFDPLPLIHNRSLFADFGKSQRLNRSKKFKKFPLRSII
jgi:hypothetical protein